MLKKLSLFSVVLTSSMVINASDRDANSESIIKPNPIVPCLTTILNILSARYDNVQQQPSSSNHLQQESMDMHENSSSDAEDN